METWYGVGGYDKIIEKVNVVKETEKTDCYFKRILR